MYSAVIIDDEDDGINVLNQFLNDFTSVKVKVTGTATSLDEGIQIIKNTNPDLVFLDIDMPGNAPNYMAYYLNDENIDRFMSSLFIQKTENFSDISICTDGIDTFNTSSEINAFDFLIKDKSLIKSEAMLSRKCNILENKGINHKDDFTIVRIIFTDEVA